MLIDDVTIHVAAGDGGDGSVAFNKNKMELGPTGASGGNGGSVYCTGVADIGALSRWRNSKEAIAGHGETGGIQYRDGEDGADFEFPVPVGTVIHNLTTGEDLEIAAIGHRILLAKGQFTLFASLWKAGKTTLICWLLKSIENQDQFIGKDTKTVNVLIISEESEAIWAKRKEEYHFGANIWLSCRPLNRKTNTQQWIQFITKTAEFCVENKIGFVIIDTLATFWPVRDENDATQ
jgi:hypothetical protein